MPEYTMLILWIALLIAFIVVEAATVQLVTICREDGMYGPAHPVELLQ